MTGRARGARTAILLVLGMATATAIAGWALAAQPRLRYGVHTLPADQRTLALAAEAGFDTVVELFSWRQIEPTRDQWHWQRPDEVVAGAAYHGLDLVVRLDQHPAWASAEPLTLNAPPDKLDDYVRFVERVAERYRGRVLGYVIWNEPNLAADWGGRRPNPEAYTQMLCRAYQAVKRADPAAQVVSAGLAPTNRNDAQAMDDRRYLDSMFRAGAAGCFDALGAHPYGFAYPPDDARGAHDGLNMARIEDLRQLMVAYGVGRKPVWATEMGWTVDGRGDQAWQTVTAQQQAKYLVRGLQRAQREWPWLGLVAIWNLPATGAPDGNGLADRPPAAFLGYSLLDATGLPRPAFPAIQALNKGRPLPGPTALRSVVVRALAPLDRQRYVVLAPDTVIHLGDSEFPPPWMPLYAVRNPSTTWHGVVYLPTEPMSGTGDWRLSLRLMQGNVWDNYLWINGKRLEPAMPTEDFSGTWVSITWQVPAAWLHPGPNQVAVAVGRTLPVLQDAGFSWDDIQIKDIILWRCGARLGARYFRPPGSLGTSLICPNPLPSVHCALWVR